MTTEQRIDALQKFGYDSGESRFLVIAALQSGYFLRRQFLAFVGGTKGAQDVAFLTKLVTNRHHRVTVYRHNRMVYHLSAKPLYDALNEPDNRNRREHQPSTVKNKIMALDFVLEHPAHVYLWTEREKLDYFVLTRNVAPGDLPVRLYSSPHGHAPAAKHFEWYPIFLATPCGQTVPLPHFCYIDEGLQTTDRFATYLGHYHRLLVALGDFHVIYVTQTPRLFASAERIFQKFMEACGRSSDPVGAEKERLLAYFDKRRRYEDRDFSEFDTASLISFREEKKRFAGEPYEGLYARWKADSHATLTGAHSSSLALQNAASTRFSTYLLEHDYDLFGTFTSNGNKRTNSDVPTKL